MQPRRRDATALPAPDPTYFSSGGGEAAAGLLLQDRVMISKAAKSPSSGKSARRTAVHACARHRRSPGRDPAPGNRSLHQRRRGLFGRAGRAVRRRLPVPDRSHRNLGQDAAGQPSRPDRHRAAAHHPRAGFRRCHRGGRPGAVAVDAARRQDPDRECAQQEPGASDGDFDPQDPERRGHRRAGPARQRRGGPVDREQSRRGIHRARLYPPGQPRRRRRQSHGLASACVRRCRGISI